MQNNNVERMKSLFDGLDRAHGEFEITGKDERGKVTGRAKSVRSGGPTEELWEAHLKGEQGLGVVPIRDDGTCSWGVIDIDIYPIDYDELQQKILDLELPLIIMQSKSMGAQLALFINGAAKADTVRFRLMEWTTLLGYPPDTEVFPKQSRLANRDDMGNWLNMPYFGDTRKAYFKGKQLSIDEFIDLAEGTRINPDSLETFLVEQPVDAGGVFSDGPPCLEAIYRAADITEGLRNDTMFSVAVYFKKKDEDTMAEELAAFNDAHVDPPIGGQELTSITKSVANSEYFYKCKNPPLNMYCNREMCRRREFGISSGNNDSLPALDHLVKVVSDEPIWRINVDGQRVELTTVDNLNYFRFFKREVMTQTSIFLPDVPQGDWQVIVKKLYDDMKEEEAPEDANLFMQFKNIVEDFASRRQNAATPEDMLRGLAFSEGGYVYFRASDLQKHLSNERFRYLNMTWVYQRLKDMEAIQKPFHIAGKHFRTWGIPEPEEQQTEEFTAPEQENEKF